MLKTNEAGVYPSILVHRSHYGQLAIGGAMLHQVYEDEEEAMHRQACPLSGGWRTHFDGGSFSSGQILDLPCDIVAMYVEGLIHISGFEGAYDSEIEIEPTCYAVAVSRSEGRRDCIMRIEPEIKETYVYLRAAFNFSDNIRHDGAYDLQNALDTASRKGPIEYPPVNTKAEWGSRRSWHLLSKKSVPGRVRQILHRTVSAVRDTVDGNFGQGKKFFQLPQKSK